MTRVVITGMAVCCSTGQNLQQFLQSLKLGRSGKAPIPVARFDTSSPIYRNRSGATLPYEEIEKLSRSDDTILTEFAISVVQAALLDAGLDVQTIYAKPTDVGICIGTTVGATYSFIKFMKGKLNLPNGDINTVLKPCTTGTIAGSIAKYFRVQGPISVISTACASGTNSVGRAFDLIRKNKVKRMIAGGVDLFSELTFSGFNSLQAVSKDACRPFDEDRDGLMLGDAAAILILENIEEAYAREARIYGEVCGYAIANEAFHATGPDPQGLWAFSVMKGALDQGSLTPAEVNYINAHGTGTKANDSMELAAIRLLLGPRMKDVYVSSTKSMVGHTLGAAGSVELVATVLGMFYDFIPPTINLCRPIKGFEEVNFVRDHALPGKILIALSNSFGFGGNVASIAVRNKDLLA